MRRKTKKASMLLSLILMIAIAVSCSKKDDPKTEETPKTKDTTAPKFATNFPKVENIKETGFDLVVNINEAGKVYYAVFPSSKASATAKEVKSGSSAKTKSVITITDANKDKKVSVTGLAMNTSYNVFTYAEDAKSNASSVVKKTIKTKAKPSTDVIRKYSGSGSKGDWLTLDVNDTKKEYLVENETTKKKDSGSFVLKTGKYEGVYEITTSKKKKFFAVEAAEKVLIANMPTGNEENDISFTVTSSKGYKENISQFAGDYIWVIMSPEDEESKGSKEWGFVTMKSDGTYSVKEYKTGKPKNESENSKYVTPADYKGSTTVDKKNADFSGNWKVNEKYPERLILSITEGGETENMTGYMYMDEKSSAFVFDLNEGNGFLLGWKISSPKLSDVVGRYSFIDTWADDAKGAGNYTINAEGKVRLDYISSDGTEQNAEFELDQSEELDNVFYSDMDMGEGEEGQVRVYFFLTGDLMMHFMFSRSDSQFISYGAGARLDD